MTSLLLFTFVVLLGHVHCVLLLPGCCTTATAIVIVLYYTVLYSTLPHSTNVLFGVNQHSVRNLPYHCRAQRGTDAVERLTSSPRTILCSIFYYAEG
jgi:hypothetical protein